MLKKIGREEQQAIQASESPEDSESDNSENELAGEFSPDDTDDSTKEDSSDSEEKGSSDSEEEKSSDAVAVQQKHEEPDATVWTSKDKKLMWHPTHEVAGHYAHPRIPTPGPTLYACARLTSPESAFALFIDDEIVEQIVEMTNLQGLRTSNRWSLLTPQELRAYIGLLLLAGVYRSRHEATSSLWGEKTGRPLFANAMSHRRFAEINGMLRFHNVQKPKQHHANKLSPISELWSRWNFRLQKMYNVGRDVCVDEQLIAFRGRCNFKQYMPSKPAKYGIKIWALCDAQTSYAYHLEVYTGKPPNGTRETNVGMCVVLRLTDSLEGHTVTTDNFFTSIPLAQELKKKRNYLLGTIRKNKPELPSKLTKITGRKPLSSIFGFTRDLAVVSYVPKKGKNVLLLSTAHKAPKVDNGDERKPQMILDYNKSKGAVDHLGQACGTYSTRRRAQRWPMSLFFHMLDISAFNACVLYKAVNPSWNAKKRYIRRLFLEELGNSLIMPEVLRRKPETAAGEKQAAEQQHEAAAPTTKRKQCHLCTEKRIASNACDKCGNPMCRKHMKNICKNC
ncbi:piggyBac transposable element-derived protein 4-like [Hippocampus zosterae]|uniref:piggyBac transposable element-derived protein 4-like n=1 Tax=Hippocampus zosterae TaxID=109293 RepID=UPI00223D0BBA|nr:piggyBac transposable element-derived protein 4-like [Hippocampus zosterae]